MQVSGLEVLPGAGLTDSGNSKEEPVTVTVVEDLYRWNTWSIRNHSDQYTKTDSQTIEFDIKLKPGQEKVVTYTVDYNW